MQFVEKVAALRRFLGVPTELQLQPAVEHMNTMMGLVGDGALPLQVDALIAATGIVVAAEQVHLTADGSGARGRRCG